MWTQSLQDLNRVLSLENPRAKIKKTDKNVVREAALMSPFVENNNLMVANNTREIGQYGHQLPNFYFAKSLVVWSGTGR